MAFTRYDLASLERAIASGERMVVLSGQSITYRSIEDLQKAYEFIKAKIEADEPSGRSRRVKAYYSGRGYN